MKSLFPPLSYGIIGFLNVHLTGLEYQPSAPPGANSWYTYCADKRNMSHTDAIGEKKNQNIYNAGRSSTIEMITIFHASNSSWTWCNTPAIEKLLQNGFLWMGCSWVPTGDKNKTSTITLKMFAASLSFCRLVRPLILPAGWQGGLVG